MVKIKVIKAEIEEDEQYVGNIYEAIKDTRCNGLLAYYAQVGDNDMAVFNQDYVEVIEDDKPTLGVAHEPDLRTIKMSDIIKDLGIDVGDIVRVNVNGIAHYLECTKEYELVNLLACYEDSVPHLILGMINGKYPYAVYTYDMGFAATHVDNEEEAL